MEPATARPADAVPDGWVDRWLPADLRPWARLMRLDRPVGAWLLLWPCWWSTVLAAGAAEVRPWDMRVLAPLAAFAAGALVMRAAGCAVNDIWDRDIDGKVARTAGRPIASGAISVTGALTLVAALGLLGLAILLSFNAPTIVVAIASLPLVVLYPLAKRVTHWPQAVLGIVFNWGALLGWTAVTGDYPGWPAAALYAGCFFWTLGYDTIYAHQDREDDIKAGVRSSALALGCNTAPALAVFYGLAVLSWGSAGWLTGAGPVFYAGLALAAAHFAWQIRRLDIDDPANCLGLFRSNIRFGWIVFAAIMAGQLG
ncbi:4-hydroxybenzoate octaprenyltransferase [Iodidimonas sp. SYSU 1G8]|uniref:4-hydroxybenzoate octaprenyltransferase n=1 Tax=Iodidimonas sp. SYSU 1G8 TaxID=3133967 RepID=UPI0031FF4438